MSNINFKIDFWKQRQKLQIQVIEDDAIRDNVDYTDLVINTLNEGFIIVYQYWHPALGQITIFEPERIFANESLQSILNQALTLEPEDPRDYPEEVT